MEKLSYDGPIVLAILDGVGLAQDSNGNAVSKARTPFLGRASREYLHIALEASGHKSLNIKKIDKWTIPYKEIRTVPNNRKQLLDYIGDLEELI